jgi:NEDD4-binding protein 2
MFGVECVKCSADDFFLKSGTYQFDARLLKKAHDECKDKANKATRDGINLIIIDNTCSQQWEMAPYLLIAKDRGYRVVFRTIGKRDEDSLKLYASRNEHGVPREAIDRMVKRFEPNPKT